MNRGVPSVVLLKSSVVLLVLPVDICILCMT